MSLQTRLEALASAVGADVKALLARGPAAQNPIFTAAGPVAIFTGTQRYYASAAGTLVLSRASLGTSGTSTTSVIIRRNNVNIIAMSLASGVSTITDGTNVAISAGDYFTILVTVAGTGAADLTVQMRIVE